MRVEVRPVAGKFKALKTEVHTLFLVAGHHAAVGILACSVAAPQAIGFGQIGQDFLEFRVIPEDRQERGESLGVDVERTQSPSQPLRVSTDRTILEGETLFTAQTTRGDLVEHLLVFHERFFLSIGIYLP
jgi:hypothetical protein